MPGTSSSSSVASSASPAKPWPGEAYGGGTGEITLTAEAEDGITAHGVDTGASISAFEDAFFLPDHDTWTFYSEPSFYARVDVVATVPGCDAAPISFVTRYIPSDWIDGTEHDLSNEGGVYVLLEARAVHVPGASVVMQERWQGSAELPSFAWEPTTPSCLTALGSSGRARRAGPAPHGEPAPDPGRTPAHRRVARPVGGCPGGHGGRGPLHGAVDGGLRRVAGATTTGRTGWGASGGRRPAASGLGSAESVGIPCDRSIQVASRRTVRWCIPEHWNGRAGMGAEPTGLRDSVVGPGAFRCGGHGSTHAPPSETTAPPCPLL